MHERHEPSSKRWRVPHRPNTGCASGRGSSCWRWTPWPAVGREIVARPASKWRVRYAEKRLAGLDETGNRGAEPKYTAATDQRILAVLDSLPPSDFARWHADLIARPVGAVEEQYVRRFLGAQKSDVPGRTS